MRRILAFWMMMALVAATVCAQQPVSVGGTVVNAATGEAVAGASISGGGQTVVTNADGYFVLKSDTVLTAITVSHVGYRSQHVAIKAPATQQLRVSLQPATVHLQEVLVVASDPRQLLRAAIARIPQNYSDKPELSHCFYRETVMKRQHYIMVAEGVADMYKTAYRLPSTHDRVAIRKGRRLLSPKQSDTLSVKVSGGPVMAVQLDLAKNLDYLLNEEELDGYELKMEAPSVIADRPQYVVSLAPRTRRPWALYYGQLYIDKETLAFSRAELTLDVSDREKATNMILVKKPAGVRFRPKELSLLIDYRIDDGMAHLSYMRTTFRFNCDWRRRLFATSFTAICEMAVTSRTADDTVKPIRGRDSFYQRDAFFDKVDYFRDPDFWLDYNIIEPTESLDRAIDRLLKKH